MDLYFIEQNIKWPGIKKTTGYSEYYCEQSIELINWAVNAKERLKVHKLVDIADKLETEKRNSFGFMIGLTRGESKYLAVIDLPQPKEVKYKGAR